MITPNQAEHDLLLATLQRFVADDAQIASSTSIPLQGGMSGSAVARHTIEYTAARGASTISLITKDAERHEWRVLQHLQSQQQPNIPFTHTIDTGDGERLQICLQDVGDQSRPTSLDPIFGRVARVNDLAVETSEDNQVARSEYVREQIQKTFDEYYR